MTYRSRYLVRQPRIRAEFDSLSEDLNQKTERDTLDTINVSRFVDASHNQYIRCKPAPTGQRLTLPPPQLGSFGDTVTVSLENPEGTLTVCALPYQETASGEIVRNTVNGAERATFTTTGVITFVSNGDTRWTSTNELAQESPQAQQIASGGSAGLDADYFLGTTNPLLPSARVAQSSSEIDVDTSTAGFVSWRYVEIPYQRVLGNDSGADGRPTPISVHQELDWIAGDSLWFFNGGTSDHQVRFGDNLDALRTDARSYSFWISVSGVIGGNILTKYVNDATAAGWGCQITTTGLLRFYIGTQSPNNQLIVTTTNAFNDGALHHVCITYTGGETVASVAIWVDGVSQATTGLDTLTSAVTSNAVQLQIGGNDTVGSWGPGYIQHVSIWSDDLTALEVAQVYNGGTPPDLTATTMAAELLAWWKFDGNDATGASGIIDYGPSGIHGTAFNGLAPSSGIGGIPARGPTQWQLVLPFASGMPLCSNGNNQVPSYRQMVLAGLPNMTDDTMWVNISGAAAPPQERTLLNMAGDGLTYDATNHHWDVVGSTSIIVTSDTVTRAALTGAITAAANSNTTAFGTLAAKSVLGVAGNATAIPAAIAGTAAFQHLRVNSANTGLEWAVLSLAAFPTMAAHTVLANITGSVAVPTAASLATLAGTSLTYNNAGAINFDGIPVLDDGAGAHSGALQLNMVSGASMSASVAAAGNQADITYTYVGSTSEVTIASATGNLGTINIAALACGGSVRVTTASSAFSIEGFTSKTDGFWFYFESDISLTNHCTLFHEDATATATNRLHLPQNTDISGVSPLRGIFYYRDSRWNFTSEDPSRIGTANAYISAPHGTTSAVDIVTVSGDVNVDSGSNIDMFASGDILLDADAVRLGCDMSVDGFIEIVQSSLPSTPVATRGRMYLENASPVELKVVGDDGVIHELAGRGSEVSVVVGGTAGVASNVGTIDISSLACGGIVRFTGVTAGVLSVTVEGFTAKNTGFFFFATFESTSVPVTWMNEDSTATATNRLRMSGVSSSADTAVTQTVNGMTMWVYAGSRWRGICGI